MAKKVNDKKKNMILIALMLVIAGVTLFVIFKDKIFKESPPSIEDTLTSPAVNTRIPKNLDTDVFGNESFRELKEYGPTDFSVKEKGKTNPFEPFQINVE